MPENRVTVTERIARELSLIVYGVPPLSADTWALDVALDVEELARVLTEHGWCGAQLSSRRPEALDEHQARAIRAHLLSQASGS